MAKNLTEDAVRDLARDILGLVDSDAARAGVGQLTTFNQLGFAGVADKPDGWYLPKNKADVGDEGNTHCPWQGTGGRGAEERPHCANAVREGYRRSIQRRGRARVQGRGGSQDARQVAARRLLTVALYRRQH